MKYIIAIDQGTQSTKLSLFDLKGRQLLQETAALLPLDISEDGTIVEHPQDDLWESLKATCQKFMTRVPEATKDGEIIGIGLGGIRFNRLLLKEDGTLAQPAISWMDARVYRAYEHTNPEVAHVVAGTGYMTHRLTGEKKDTVGNYQGAYPIDGSTWDLIEDQTVYDLFQIPREMLFELKMPGDILGHITPEASKETGLPTGLPVIATSNDKAVEGLGAGLRGEDTLLASLGTYTTTMIEGQTNYPDPKNFFANFGDQPRKYLYESGGILRGMWTISWFKGLLGKPFEEYARKEKTTVEAILNEEAGAVPLGSDGLMTLLDWMGPLHAPFRKGSMLGFDGRHGRGHMFRSILEGLVFNLRFYSGLMLQETGLNPTRLIVSGGGSNSDLVMQIFADVFNMTTVRNEINGSASLGAAINVAVTMGEYDSYDQAISGMVRIKDEFKPIPENVVAYLAVFTHYMSIWEVTDPYYEKLAKSGGN